jgi:hypothetical protein
VSKVGFLGPGDRLAVPIGEGQRVGDNNEGLYPKALTRGTFHHGAYPKQDGSGWDANARQERGAYIRPTDQIDCSDGLDKHSVGSNRLQVMEERLQVNKEREQAGTVRLCGGGSPSILKPSTCPSEMRTPSSSARPAPARLPSAIESGCARHMRSRYFAAARPLLLSGVRICAYRTM